MTAPTRAELIAFVREKQQCAPDKWHKRMFTALLAELEGMRDDDLTRQSSPCPTCGTGSPRSPQPEGSEQ